MIGEKISNEDMIYANEANTCTGGLCLGVSEDSLHRNQLEAIILDNFLTLETMGLQLAIHMQ